MSKTDGFSSNLILLFVFFVMLSFIATAYGLDRGTEVSADKSQVAQRIAVDEGRKVVLKVEKEELLNNKEKVGYSYHKVPIPSSVGRVLATAKGVVSFYGKGFFGRRTSSGTRYSGKELTAAHKTLPFGSRVRVSHRGKSVIVKIEDRGPYIGDRKLDLSPTAFAALAPTSQGLIKNAHIELLSVPKDNKTGKPAKFSSL